MKDERPLPTWTRKRGHFGTGYRETPSSKKREKDQWVLGGLCLSVSWFVKRCGSCKKAACVARKPAPLNIWECLYLLPRSLSHIIVAVPTSTPFTYHCGCSYIYIVVPLFVSLLLLPVSSVQALGPAYQWLLGDARSSSEVFAWLIKSMIINYAYCHSFLDSLGDAYLCKICLSSKKIAYLIDRQLSVSLIINSSAFCITHYQLMIDSFLYHSLSTHQLSVSLINNSSRCIDGDFSRHSLDLSQVLQLLLPYAAN